MKRSTGCGALLVAFLSLAVQGIPSTADAQAGPSVVLTHPTSGQTLSGIVRFDATSSGASSVAYYVDGVEVAQDLTCCTWDEDVDTVTLADGTHSVYAVATGSGGRTRTPGVPVTVRNGTPTSPATPPGTAGDSPAAPTGVPGTWDKRWSDDFTGTALDTGRWSTMHGAKMNAITASSSNVRVADGELQLQLASTTSGAHLSSSRNDGAGVNGTLLAVGEVAEARIHFPGVDGDTLRNWSAFWTSGSPWPTAGEIDVAEILYGKLTHNYHHADASGIHVAQNGGGEAGFQPGNSWHTYAVHRTATEYRVHWDGQLVWTVAEKDDGAGHSLLLTVGNGSNDGLGWSNAMRVAYVAVYRPA